MATVEQTASKNNETGMGRAKILTAARALIGKKYDELDCSHMVWNAYKAAGYDFPYSSTSSYESILIDVYFIAIEEKDLNPADLILYAGHVGIYDPDGCTVVNTAQCQAQKDNTDMRILSARSGKNLGTEYGRSTWFGKPKKYLKWSEF